MKLNRLAAVFMAGCMLALSCSFTGCSNKPGVGFGETKENSAKGNTSGNIINLGAAAEYDGKIYYQNGEDGYSIYCSEPDGSNPVKLNDVESYFINAAGGCIVYANANDDYHIYKMNIDGSENTKLNDVQSYYVSLYGDYIYYSNWSDGNKIYKLSLDGSENIALCDDIAYYVSVEGDRIYYSNWSENAKLYSINLDGESRLKLTESGCWYPVSDGEWIYYSQWKNVGTSKQDDEDVDKNDKFLCRVKTDGSEKQVLHKVPCGDINVYDGRIYFTNWIENNIYSIKTDGSDVKKLSDTYGVYLNAAGGRLYFVEYDENKTPVLKNIPLEGEKIEGEEK